LVLAPQLLKIIVRTLVKLFKILIKLLKIRNNFFTSIYLENFAPENKIFFQISSSSTKILGSLPTILTITFNNQDAKKNKISLIKKKQSINKDYEDILFLTRLYRFSTKLLQPLTGAVDYIHPSCI